MKVQALLKIAAIALILLSLNAACPAAADDTAPSNINWQSRIEAERTKVAAENTEAVEVGSTAQIGRMLEGLAYCLATFLIGFHIFKKYYASTQQSTRRNLKILESINLPGKTYLHLVEADGRRLLVGSGQQQVSVVKLDDELGMDVVEARVAADANEERIC